MFIYLKWARSWGVKFASVDSHKGVLGLADPWLHTDHDEIGEELGRAVILFTHQVVCRVGLRILFYMKSVL